jgi:hypothetical protein
MEGEPSQAPPCQNGHQNQLEKVTQTQRHCLKDPMIFATIGFPEIE